MNHLKNNIFKLASIALTSTVISACDGDFSNPVEEIARNNGSADFTKFVSVGDSLTAGYADAALYLNGQNNSYPAILAQQFAQVDGGVFVQPLVNDNLGGLLFGGVENPDFANRLVFDGATQKPEPIAGTPTTEVFELQTGAFNNMGVPGAKSYHLTSDTYGDPAGLATNPATANPYYVRFAPSATTSIIAASAGQLPSFFTLWIGNNDILSYATTGGVGTDQTGNLNPPPYGSNDITDPTWFAAVYNGLVGGLVGASPTAKGVLINLPDVSSIPYFTTVPYNPVPLDEASATALNTAYAPYNGGIQAALGAALITAEEAALRTISFTAGSQNAVVILDEDLTDLTGTIDPAVINMRQATADDLLILPTSAKIGELADPADDPLDPASPRWGISAPLLDGDVLIPSEITSIETARLAFNVTIKAAADADDNLLFFDVAMLMEETKVSGYDYGTGSVNANYASGGAFSLDGVHLTARGYAIIANEIINTINTGFDANIAPVNPGDHTTIFIK